MCIEAIHSFYHVRKRGTGIKVRWLGCGWLVFLLFFYVLEDV
jgi:hypothetical protein